MARGSFKAAGYPWRLFAGPGVIESDPRASVERVKARRAMVICSPSVNRRGNTVQRIQAALGNRCVGVFDGIEKDSTYASVQSACAAAREIKADLLSAVGGGSVIVAVRAVAVDSRIFVRARAVDFPIEHPLLAQLRPMNCQLEHPEITRYRTWSP